MSGVYGGMLENFPELLSAYEIFTMPALAGGGFGPRKKFATVTGYVQRALTGDAGFPDDTFTENQRATFFTIDDVPRGMIRQGMYVEDDGELYKFIQDNTFSREGGFSAHKLQLVAGPTDREVPNAQVEENVLNGY